MTREHQKHDNTGRLPGPRLCLQDRLQRRSAPPGRRQYCGRWCPLVARQQMTRVGQNLCTLRGLEAAPRS
ncbi:hypothetical protein EYF80_061596 [Liparis tanakae]|uniref:Uncharacterized protein n=1 Tax=Liparis tanakae TaxID=230148 RepID=A0A4Z2EHM6_9TELE|nr:hypothetical protein EYF80_061596 [Liparis tanakae]